MTESKQVPVRVDVGLKAEAGLKLKGEIPSRALGRLVDAFTDVIRPFSESRGLKADHIRLQREEVAIEIARRAQARVAIEGAPIQAVPTKILVPLIERGSCEDPDDEPMVERWASLLASASMKLPVQPRFVGILEELAGSQAECLEHIAFNRADEQLHPLTYFDGVPLDFAEEHAREELDGVVREAGKAGDTFDVVNALVGYLTGPGVYIQAIIPKEGEDFENDYVDPDLSSKIKDSDLSIIESLGLVKRVFLEIKCTSNRKKPRVFYIYYYHLSGLGVDFLNVCSRRKILQLKEMQEEASRRIKALGAL